MSEYNLIKTEAVKTLIEAVRDGIGVLYEPTRIKRRAKAEACAMQIKERALIAINEERELAKIELTERIRERKAAQEISRQQNIDDVVAQSIQILENEPAAEPEKKVNKDWTVRFFDIVQDISDSEMKAIWARILASEIKDPDSFSFRSMELLRNISKTEATMFIEIAKYVLISGNDAFILKNDDGELKDFGITFDMIARMVEAGFIHPESNMQMNYTIPKEGDDIIMLRYGNRKIEIKGNIGMVIPPLPIYAITTFGKESLRLRAIEPSEGYVHLLNDQLKGYVKSVTMKESE